MSKSKLLLHLCCAPCASAVLEKLQNDYEITGFYFNPNIQPLAEYQRRLAELGKLQRFFDFKLLIGEYKPALWQTQAKGLEQEPERGRRCQNCFDFRLRAAALQARDMGLPIFGTTLTVSPHKNAAQINSSGEAMAKNLGIQYLKADFKKQNGYLRSLELSARFKLYRQNYCGCLSSLKPVKIPSLA